MAKATKVDINSRTTADIEGPAYEDGPKYWQVRDDDGDKVVTFPLEYTFSEVRIAYAAYGRGIDVGYDRGKRAGNNEIKESVSVLRNLGIGCFPLAST